MDVYEEFLLTVRRDINCLTDNDRRTRQGAVGKLQKALLAGGKNAPPAEFVRRVFLEELHKPLFRLFGDQTEKCRELSMAMTFQFVDLLPVDDLENTLPLLLAALLGRLRVLPFPEQSEELRLEALRLLSHLFDVCQERLNPFASDIINALSKALTDTCPDAKKTCCEITKKVSAIFDPERVGRAGAPLVEALLANLRHQQWKVRRATLDSLGALLCLEAVMLEHMEEVLPHLNALLGDRTPGVRQCLAECLEKWLLKGLAFKTPRITNFDDDGPTGFDKFEHRLLLLLLGVAADEDTEQVAPLALGGLERAGALKHEVLKKRAEAERAKEQARRKAKSGGTEEDAAAPSAITDPEVAPEFDYAVVRALLPEPFGSGQAPAVLTTTYVQLHLPSILPQVLANLTQWTSEIRWAAARLLRVMLVLVNRQVAPFLDQVLVHLYKSSADDEVSVAKASLQCAEMAGAFLDMGMVLGLVGRHLGLKNGSAGAARGPGTEELWPEARTGRQLTRTVQDVESGVRNFTAASVENKRQVFAVLAHLLRPGGGGPEKAKLKSGEAASTTRPLRKDEVHTTIRFLEEGGQSDDLLPWILAALRSLLTAGGPLCCEEWPKIFDLLLRMRSGRECNAEAVDDSMDTLAGLCGRSRRTLYEEHLRTRLEELLLGADTAVWEEHSAKRHILDTLLRNAGGAAAEHIGSLVPALARQACPEDAPVAARVDILGVVHFLINEEDPALTNAMRQHAPGLLQGVLIPNCTWRAGQSNNKIRKGGLVCMHSMLQRRLLESASVNAAFADLLPILKSALDDNWSPENRMVACLVLSCTLSLLQADITSEQLREVYPELLKRLDDSNNDIRVTVCEALSVFFRCLPPKWSRSLYEYILRTLFVHLDDPSPEIQQGIYGVLEVAVHQDNAAFSREAEVARAKSAHPRLCEELGRLAESLQRASAEEVDADVSTDGPPVSFTPPAR
jgi:dynein assembly factor 5